jgi:macrolide transport system ATP-binding/permease protein
VTTTPTAGRTITVAARATELSKIYGQGETQVVALDRVSVDFRQAEFTAIMGPSGSGKSTLMHCVAGLDSFSSGSVRIGETELGSLKDKQLTKLRRDKIGFIFQAFNLLPTLTALENITLPMDIAGRKPDKAWLDQVIAMIGLSDRLGHRPSQLSGGQQQRVAVARALINEPALLLADEPMGNLDSKTAADIMTTLRELNRSRGLTIVLVTHEPDMAEFADRVVTMRDGEIVSDERRDVPPSAVDATATVGTATMATATGASAAAGRVPNEAASSSAKAAEPSAPAAPPIRDAWSFARMALLAAGRTLGRNKMRSALTMLGIFIGVTALITMVAVGQGANAAVEQSIEALGTNLVMIVPGARTSNGVRAGFGSASTLTVMDAQAIKQEDPAVADVGYEIRGGAQVQSGNQNWTTRVEGVSPSFTSIRNWPIVAGRSLTDEDERNASRVALLGQTVVKSLFGDYENPVGATIFIKNVSVEVVGVLGARGQTGFGQDQDDTVLIPFTTAERKVLGVSTPSMPPAQSETASQNPGASASNPYGTRPNPFGVQSKLTGFVNVIFVQAASTGAVPVAIEQLTQTLRARHHLQPGDDDDFSARNISDITQAAQSSSRIMALLLITVASISLLVGGIGIMNILLVSVTERTREIGVRMAIGARRVQVLVQFLIEAVLLSAIGGGIGVLMGIAIAALGSRIAGWPTLLSPAAVVGGFLFSAAVRVFFGYYPARRAARLNPIEALRFE